MEDTINTLKSHPQVRAKIVRDTDGVRVKKNAAQICSRCIIDETAKESLSFTKEFGSPRSKLRMGRRIEEPMSLQGFHCTRWC